MWLRLGGQGGFFAMAKLGYVFFCYGRIRAAVAYWPPTVESLDDRVSEMPPKKSPKMLSQRLSIYSRILVYAYRTRCIYKCLSVVFRLHIQMHFGCISVVFWVYLGCISVVFRLYFGCISVAYTNALQVHFRLRASGPSRSFAFAPAALRLQSKCTPDHPEQTALVRAAQGYLFGGGLSQK